MPSITQDLACRHCGDAIDAKPITRVGENFCCEGCATVYCLLHDNGMADFYALNDRPGRKMDYQSDQGRYAFLDLDEIRSKLLSFNESGVARLVWRVPAIHCSSCIYLLENLPKLNGAVLASNVNFVRKEATITFRISDLKLSELAVLLDHIGYPPDLSLKDLDHKEPVKADRDLLYRLGVAGFCFGNIMLLSFPEYLSGHEVVEPQYQYFFNLLNLALGLPVFFYSAMIYLRSAYTAVAHRSLNIDVPLAIGIVALFGRSAFEILSGTGVGFMDSLAGLIFFLLVGRWFQDRTYKALSFDRDYRSYFPMAVTRISGNKEEPVMLADLKAGDDIIIRSHAIIPADAELLSNTAKLDYSFVTGESEPVTKHRGDQLFAGGRQVGASIKVRLRSSVTQSYLTQLWEQSGERKESMGKVGTVMDRVARRFTIYILTVAAIAAVAWWFIDPNRIVEVVTAVLIIACPCGLAITIPFALGNAMRLLARNGLHVRDTASIERLAEIDTAVFDKTGTLTESEGAMVSFTGDLDTSLEPHVSSLANQSAHPLSKAISKFLGNQYSDGSILSYEEHPGKGIEALVGGAALKLGSATWLLGRDDARNEAGSRVYVEVDGLVRGYFTVVKPLRKGVEGAVKSIADQTEVHLLSGDRDTEKSRFSGLFDDAKMYFGQTPFDKRERIKQLQADGKKVMMVGDGLNDSGALGQSNVGISVVDDLAQFTPACDAILEAHRISDLPQFMQFSKTAMKVVRVGFITSFLYNSTGIILAVQGLVSPLVAAILMPLSSITVVALGTLGTELMARKIFK